MHELSLIANLFDILEAKVTEEKISRITQIKLRCGLFAGVVPECLQTAFDVYKKGTFASEATLVLEVVPIKFRCRRCGQESTREDLPLVCPLCQSSDVAILDGTELTLVSLEAEIQSEEENLPALPPQGSRKSSS
ncbi:MAG: hydrogenase maturation nickel metallochaperone HypA [Candidatus Aminicenantales bacterium]